MRRLLVRRKKFFFIGGIVAFLIVAGVVLVNKLQPQEASAAGETGVVSYGSWTGFLNGWRTKYFTLNDQRAWCGDLAGNTPINGGSYTMKTVAINNSSPTKEKDIFKAMYYGVAEGKSDVYIHEVINDILNEDTVVSRAEGTLYYKATHNALPNKNNMKIYYTDPNDYGLSSRLRDWRTQRIFSYSYEDVQQVMSLEIKKNWNDELNSDYDYPDIKVKVTRDNGGPVLNENGLPNVELSSPITLKQSEDFTRKFTGLLAGQQFKVEELMTNSGFVEVDPGDGSSVWRHESIKVNDNYIYYKKNTDGNNEEGVCGVSGLKGSCRLDNNQYKYSGIRLFLKKIWKSDEEEIARPEKAYFKIKVFAGNDDITAEYQNGRFENNYYSVKSRSSDEWSGYVSNVTDDYIINGQSVDIEFYVAEINDLHYTNIDKAFGSTCTTEKKTIDGRDYCLATDRAESSDLEATITNTPEYVTLTIKKTWRDGLGAIYGGRPRMIFYNIYRDDDLTKPVAETGIWNECIFNMDSCTYDDEWETDVELPKYYRNAAGQYVLATYTIEEKDFDFDDGREGGLSKKYNMRLEGNNSINTAKMSIPVKKCWVDKDASKRPGFLKFRIYQGESTTAYKDDIELTSANADSDGCWTGEFTDLPAYDDDGNALTYRVEEITTLGSNYEAAATTCTVDVADRIRNQIVDGRADMSCDFVNYQLIDIPVKKCWVDKDDSTRPDKLVFEIYQDNSTTAYRLPLELTSNNADDDGCWTGTFKNLPAYNSNKRPHTYTVKEVLTDIDNYVPEEENGDSCTINIASNSAWNNGLTCSFTNVELVDIPVKKVWAEDKKEDRPGSIEVSLLCGEDVLDTVTLSEENNLDGDNTWEYTWTNRRVDECGQGYSIAENINVPGYTSKITGNAEDGFVITNTKTLDEILTWGSLGAGSFGAIAASFFVVKRKFFSR